MSSSADEFVKKAVEHRENGRIDGAIIAARHATILEAGNANTWWQLALALNEKDGPKAAIPHFKKTTELAPSFAYGWHRLGLAYQKTGQLDIAIECWEAAIGVSDQRIDSMEALLIAYGERKQKSDDDKAFGVLRRLESKGSLDSERVNKLGIEYYNRKDFYKAIACFRRYAAETTSAIGYFNLGLAFNSPIIGQHVDAIDAWRRALERDGSDERARSMLSEALKRHLKLVHRLKSQQDPLLDEDQWYSNYINPFELLNLDHVEGPCELDPKELQSAKKLLLHEIELEDGKVEWMPGLHIDRSRAIQVADELNDEVQRRWHHIVYRHKRLLNFLSRGTLDQFLAEPEVSPLELLDILDEHADDFAPWLSKRVTPQFDLLLSKAFERKNLLAVECLLEGRRWVVPEDEDKCFNGAHRQMAARLETLRDAAAKAETTKPSLEALKRILETDGIGTLLSILPIVFQKEQGDAASLIRSMSIDAYNRHDDVDLAMAILDLAGPIVEKVPSLKHRLDEDRDALREELKKAQKHEASLTWSGATYAINRKGVAFRDVHIPVAELETIRWGISVLNSNGLSTYKFSIVLSSKRAQASISWESSKDHEKQEELFNSLVGAASAYVLPTVIGKVQAALDRGETVLIGSVPVRNSGITFAIAGWFSTKYELCPWSRLRVDLSNGQLHISDPNHHKAKVSLSLCDIDNAFVLYLLIKNFPKADK